jgi:hypothetical protein
VPAAIDVHAHVIVPELLRDAAPDELWRPALHDGHIELSGRRVRSIVHSCVELDEINPSLEPFWAAAEQHDALVFVHPTTRGFPGAVFDQYYLWNLVGNPFETTIAAAPLVLSGTIARHQRVRVMLAHGGGALLALSGRIRHGQATVRAAGPAATTCSVRFCSTPLRTTQRCCGCWSGRLLPTASCSARITRSTWPI